MMKIDDKNSQVLSHFRTNARISLTELSKQTKIPVSTLFEKLKTFEENNFITKHTSLIDFSRLGFDIRVQILIESTDKTELSLFLSKNSNVNNVFRINNGFDFLVDAIFSNISDLDVFMQDLKNQHVKKTKEFFVLEELQRERFMECNSIISV